MVGHLCGWNYDANYCGLLWKDVRLLLPVLARNVDNITADWQTDSQNLPPTISSLKYKVSKFLCQSASCESYRNDAERHTIYAKSDCDD